jgi:ABC-type amino acid transport substrate-binding protein
VDEAIGAMRESGELEQITDQWIGAEAPVLALE